MSTEVELLNEYDAARRLGLSVATIRRRRLLRQPPTYIKLGARVLYRREDLDLLVEASAVRFPRQKGRNKSNIGD